MADKPQEEQQKVVTKPPSAVYKQEYNYAKYHEGQPLQSQKKGGGKQNDTYGKGEQSSGSGYKAWNKWQAGGL